MCILPCVYFLECIVPSILASGLASPDAHQTPSGVHLACPLGADILPPTPARCSADAVARIQQNLPTLEWHLPWSECVQRDQSLYEASVCISLCFL